ncbi:MAG: hypothetical protein GXO30_01250 [Epsilonproteobacteria bacterium]|nr:hypothetical protein [Campylobacterota bacterium]
MRLFISIFMIFMISSNLSAYSRSIVVSTYAKKKDAKLALTSTQKKYAKFSRLVEYAKENDFEVNILKTGKYFVIVVEPFFDKTTLKKALKKIKEEFSTAFATNYLGLKKIKKVEEPKKAKKEISPIDIKKHNNQEMKEIVDAEKCSWIFGCEE